MNKRLFTSESVTEGHPDKVADQISDAILDAILEKEPEENRINARAAVETLVTTGVAVVAGEIRTTSYVDIAKIVRETIVEIGYDRAKYGFDGETCAVMVSIDEQSADIAMGVDKNLETKSGKEDFDPYAKIGAGDQGIMFGYATNETPEYMPTPIVLSHQLAYQLAKVRKDGTLKYLRPDGKTQVTVEYDENNKPIAVNTILISTQHSADVTRDQIEKDLIKYVINPIVPESLINDETKILVNPTGRFVLGGPQADTGLTGRKIIVDTYGGWIAHGGGAFSGKDPTKVDRSAHYMARYVAKNLVAAGVADEVMIQLGYAIGVAEPVSLLIDTKGTAKVDEEKILKTVKELFDFRPGQIIKNLNLLQPIYRQTAAYGHFGRTDVEFPWEKLDKVSEIKTALGI
ncbi:methionine adenosyltransferase [Oceanotoga teriensis]|jgi:S-adenosylmethionine synthetase|uniref:methionine adenosyltransferase n=1 Tax=Oceanotoga teriensis TaxID=515440 RepID=UPI0027130038|nr:methionine adenosyltransferase [Oceanotoga teriensis]MDO7977359.1 methionine adenosyltransferase [Oceanotoga teriensis]